MMSRAPYTMCSAVDFLPSSMSRLVICVTNRFRYTGSGWISRFGALILRAIYSHLPALLGRLDTVFGAALLAISHTSGVEGRANDLVPDSWEVFDPAAPDENHRVLLEIMPDAGDVGGDLHPVRETHTRHLAQSRVRLLGRGGVHAGAHASLLRSSSERRRLTLLGQLSAAFSYQLIYGRHERSSVTIGSLP